MATRIEVRTTRREELVDITDRIEEVLAPAAGMDGLVHVQSLHTTCGLTLNEGHDPDVAGDMVRYFRELVPPDARFRHAEGNSDAHIKTTMFGPGLTVPIEDGRLLLGTWQRVFLAEWDGPRTRTVVVTVVAGAM